MNEPRKPFVEKRSTWSFTTAGGRWVWSVSRPDGTRSRSQSVFGSLAECIEDAAREGYVPLKPLVERREQPELFSSGGEVGDAQT